MKMSEEEQELKEYLNEFTCRGCYNHCSLDNPGCGRSKVWINEAIEKFNKMENKYE